MYGLWEDLACIALIGFISSVLFLLCVGGFAIEEGMKVLTASAGRMLPHRGHSESLAAFIALRSHAKSISARETPCVHGIRANH